ncbi:MAG TPA: CHAT domain-containing tetratricopeptide repeat protein [Chitinophagaceae bacterium]|nr:CHAT domain-containing tetratricopeptide repeat protein [Chitinophagaceae bacterium]
MPGKLLLQLPACLLLVVCLYVYPGKSPEQPISIYHRADQFFNSAHPTTVTDSLALAGFEEVIRRLQEKPGKLQDSLLFQCYLKKGILLDVLNKNAEAKTAYLQAASVQQKNGTSGDSLLFKPFVYAGTNYFNLNNFDSANYYLIKAEALVKRYPRLPEIERLYNTLGALHYVNGNYLQSRNYFTQAVEFVKSHQPFDAVFALGLQANIAAAYYKLGQYKASLAFYQQIIKEEIPAGYIYNGIWMNMGKAYLATQQFDKALQCFHKIDAAAMPGVYNELARCFYALHNTAEAERMLNKLNEAGKKEAVNLLDVGINQLYRADLLADRQQYQAALQTLQQSIIIFSGNFTNTDIFSNPASFSGSYTYYRLFEALYKKARLFEQWQKTTTGDRYLQASLNAYNAAITLLAFIEKSYDTDDAKLFLKKQSEELYGQALAVCLSLHRLHPAGGYLEKAFMISEKNKASIMAANLRQNSSNATHGLDASFVQAEKNIKFALARIDIKSEQTTDTRQLEQLAREKSAYEVQLSQLQKSMEQNSHYYKLKYEEDFQAPAQISRQLAADQALFSLYIANGQLHLFSFTRAGCRYTAIDSVAALQQKALAWITALKTAGNGKKFWAPTLGASLYQQLIQPMQALAPAATEWIIIPDGPFNLLPFESLPDGNTGKTLLETTTISYQLSARFMLHPPTEALSAEMPAILSLAPFTALPADGQPRAGAFPILPASASEIALLKGTAYTADKATKEIFLQEASRFSVIHLATHAVANAENAGGSFIAFYPGKATALESRLYLKEIYGLNLEACKLVVVSACETGDGAIVNNEGVISLGRAFAYAGCGASVNSLWKADDKATAAILQSFHTYLAQGYTKSKALQKAKIDYLNSDALYKSPAYWSNLVLTGNTAPIVRPRSNYWWPVAAVTAICIVTGMLTRKKRKKSRRFSQLPIIHQ